MRVPRLVVEPGRIPQGDPVRVGLPERHRVGLRTPGGVGRHLARVRVHQSRPICRAVGRPPRRARRPLRRLPVRASRQGGPRREDHACQLEGVPGGVHGVVPRRGDTPDVDGLSRRRQHPLRHLHELLACDLAAGHREPAPRRYDPLRTSRGCQAVRPLPPSDERPHLRTPRAGSCEGGRSRRPRERLRRRRQSPRGPGHPGRSAPVQMDRRPDPRWGPRCAAEHAGSAQRRRFAQ